MWESEGVRIVKSMESVSGLKFKETAIAIVFEGVSRSGNRVDPACREGRLHRDEVIYKRNKVQKVKRGVERKETRRLHFG